MVRESVLFVLATIFQFNQLISFYFKFLSRREHKSFSDVAKADTCLYNVSFLLNTAVARLVNQFCINVHGNTNK